MKYELIELQKRIRAINRTIAEIEKKDDKQQIGINQLRIELETINNDLLKLIVSLDE